MRSLAVALCLILVIAVTRCKFERGGTPAAEEPSQATRAEATEAAHSWSQTASQYRGRNGERFTVNCSGQAQFGSVWGTDLYTDDSSICTAAVHAALITRAGGPVSFEIRPGQNSYVGTNRNGVSSGDYGAWAGSYVLVGKDGKAIEPRAGEGRLAGWTLSATDHADAIGQRFTYTCSPNGTFAPVWGTDVYTADSSICTAGVHAGLITRAGGTVTIEMRPGQPSYTGSERNGVTSGSWGQYGASFAIVRR